MQLLLHFFLLSWDERHPPRPTHRYLRRW